MVSTTSLPTLTKTLAIAWVAWATPSNLLNIASACSSCLVSVAVVVSDDSLSSLNACLIELGKIASWILLNTLDATLAILYRFLNTLITLCAVLIATTPALKNPLASTSIAVVAPLTTD